MITDRFFEILDHLRELTQEVDLPNAYWIRTADGGQYETNDGAEWCWTCGTFMVRHLRRRAKKDREGILLDGGWRTEHDSPPRCAHCGELLEHILTDYGAMEELDHFRHWGVRPGSSADALAICAVLEAVAYPKTDEDHELADEAAAVAEAFLWSAT